MKPRALLAGLQRKPEHNGFAGMSELVIAAGVGTVLNYQRRNVSSPVPRIPRVTILP